MAQFHQAIQIQNELKCLELQEKNDNMQKEIQRLNDVIDILRREQKKKDKDKHKDKDINTNMTTIDVQFQRRQGLIVNSSHVNIGARLNEYKNTISNGEDNICDNTCVNTISQTNNNKNNNTNNNGNGNDDDDSMNVLDCYAVSIDNNGEVAIDLDKSFNAEIEQELQHVDPNSQTIENNKLNGQNKKDKKTSQSSITQCNDYDYSEMLSKSMIRQPKKYSIL